MKTLFFAAAGAAVKVPGGGVVFVGIKIKSCTCMREEVQEQHTYRPTCGIRGATIFCNGIHAFLEVGIRRIPWNTFPWNTWNTSGIRA